MATDRISGWCCLDTAGGASRSPNLLKFRSEALSLSSSPFSVSPFTEEAGSGLPKRAPRRVPRSPFKVLDAPALQDDFYLNLVDWSSQNILAVGLSTCVYLWSAHAPHVTKLCDLGPRDSICSVAWTSRGNNLAVGTREGEVQVRLTPPVFIIIASFLPERISYFDSIWRCGDKLESLGGC